MENFLSEPERDIIKLLYSQHYSKLIAISYKYVRCKESSKDIIADVFIKLLSLKGENGREVFQLVQQKPLAYLTIMVKNKSIDHLRSKKTINKTEGNCAMDTELICTNKAGEKFFYEDILRITMELEPREKEILLKHLEGFKNKEIAVELGISYNTVKNKIYDAKNKIKKFF